MLYITEHIDSKERVHQWHVGDHLPKITARVVTFQADCDELDLIIGTLRENSKSHDISLEEDLFFTRAQRESDK